MKYEIVLGLEIHMQLKTDMKMFCSCRNDPFYSDVNTNVCPVCLGLPGAMPIPNELALEKAQLMAFALGTVLNKHVIFERKNYFYPDLPKAFQLTCPHDPIGIGGEFEFPFEGSLHKTHWREIHLEEDTAKSMHKDGLTWVDYNKSGVPLLEMVTEPDFRSIDEAVAFCKEVQLVARYLDISDADMEKGHMRLEANVSMRNKGETELPDYRTELKNINSFGFMKKALEGELRRQSSALDTGEKLEQETRGYNENTGETFSQRSKEEANDYRYFPEPDIPPIIYTSEQILEITTSKLELPNDRRNSLRDGGLKNEQYIESLIKNSENYVKYTELTSKLKNIKPNKIASIVLDKPEFAQLDVASILKKLKEEQYGKVDSEEDLVPIIEKIVIDNTQAVEDYKAGNENSIQFLIGKVMKETRGKADPALTRKLILTQLEQSS